MLKSLATQPEVFAQGTNVLDSIVKVYTVYSRPGGLPTRSPPPSQQKTHTWARPQALPSRWTCEQYVGVAAVI